MKKRYLSIPLILVGLFVAACAQGPHVPVGQQLENQQQKQATESLVNNQPIPHFAYSQLRQNLIELETALANGVQTTSFFMNQGVADPEGVCPSIGAPIANTSQLSNPQQVVDGSGNNGGGNVTVGQMDPYGIYTPSASSGTFVMCVGADGKPYADYWEGFVRTIFGPAKWNYTTHAPELIGPSSFTFTAHK